MSHQTDGEPECNIYDDLDPVDAIPHLVLSTPNGKPSKNLPEPKKPKRERKSVKAAPTKKPRVKKNAPPTDEEDKKLEDLRIELKYLILKRAESEQLSEEELKKEISKVARLKEKDLQFELEKLRIKASSTWTKELARSLTEGVGTAVDTGMSARGHVATEFREDKNLQSVVHGQLEGYAFKMTPNARILMLTLADVVKGYSKKRHEDQKNSVLQPVSGEKFPPPPPLVRQTGYIKNKENKDELTSVL